MAFVNNGRKIASQTGVGDLLESIYGRTLLGALDHDPNVYPWRASLVKNSTMALRAVFLFSIVVLASGCAVGPLSRAHPSLTDKLKGFRNVAIISPRVDIFYLETGGLPEKRDDWSEQARKNILVAVQSELQSKTKLAIQPSSRSPVDPEAQTIIDRTYGLFEAVSQSVLLHTYHPRPEYRFEDKIENFDYSLGDGVKPLTFGESDSLLLVTGKDHIWSDGRKALQALGVVLGIGAGVATGMVIIPQLGGGTDLQAALVDGRSGDLLWYHAVGGGAGHDLRDPESAASLVKNLFSEFPSGAAQ